MKSVLTPEVAHQTDPSSVGIVNAQDLQALLEQTEEFNRLRDRIQATLAPESQVIESVLQFTTTFPPSVFEEKVRIIREALLEMGCQHSNALDQLAEYLFAEIFVGRPVIDNRFF